LILDFDSPAQPFHLFREILCHDFLCGLRVLCGQGSLAKSHLRSSAQICGKKFLEFVLTRAIRG
jgi:hypothetical protein